MDNLYKLKEKFGLPKSQELYLFIYILIYLRKLKLLGLYFFLNLILYSQNSYI